MSTTWVVLAAFLEPAWPSVISLTGGGVLGWSVARKVNKSRGEGLVRAFTGFVVVKVISRSFRDEDVPVADRHKFFIKFWWKNQDLGDPPDTGLADPPGTDRDDPPST
jgi:hypothetical protein